MECLSVWRGMIYIMHSISKAVSGSVSELSMNPASIRDHFWLGLCFCRLSVLGSTSAPSGCLWRAFSDMACRQNSWLCCSNQTRRTQQNCGSFWAPFLAHLVRQSLTLARFHAECWFQVIMLLYQPKRRMSCVESSTEGAFHFIRNKPVL